MSTYTYVVDHGESSPSVGAKTSVNGGKLVGVFFCDQLEKNEKAREILESLTHHVSGSALAEIEIALTLI